MLHACIVDEDVDLPKASSAVCHQLDLVWLPYAGVVVNGLTPNSFSKADRLIRFQGIPEAVQQYCATFRCEARA